MQYWWRQTSKISLSFTNKITERNILYGPTDTPPKNDCYLYPEYFTCLFKLKKLIGEHKSLIKGMGFGCIVYKQSNN